jgi:ligand-binding SRPBCC domain-containing protein
MHTLLKTQVLPVSPDRLWDFISRPSNLNLITPPDMEFQIIGDAPDRVFAGQFIEYRVKVPILGRTSWLTEIKYLDEGRSFVDEQRVGPYKLWIHRHHLEEVESGTRMIDDIRYALPWGVLGSLANVLFVRRDLERIFEYRRDKLPALLRNEGSSA